MFNFFITTSLFFIGIIAAYLGTFVSGGTSSLAVGFMILLGIPPQITKATYQLGLLGWSVSGVRNFFKSGHIPWKYINGSVISTFLGGIIGGNLMTITPNFVLQKLTGVVFLIFLILTYFRRNSSHKSVEVNTFREYFVYFGQFLLSILSGFIPGAAGSLYFILYSKGIGITTLSYKALGRVTGLALSLGTLYPIYKAGLIHIHYVVPFFIGMYLGGHLGTKHIIEIGESIATKIVYSSIFFLAIYLIFS